ncbi:MAG: hypothetical protein IJD80_06460 [Oscillospiraceae bacterium]|nr:hypothetical protein [Oscillospiraceae bacterium]
MKSAVIINAHIEKPANLLITTVIFMLLYKAVDVCFSLLSSVYIIVFCFSIGYEESLPPVNQSLIILKFA